MIRSAATWSRGGLDSSAWVSGTRLIVSVAGSLRCRRAYPAPDVDLAVGHRAGHV